MDCRWATFKCCRVSALSSRSLTGLPAASAGAGGCCSNPVLLVRHHRRPGLWPSAVLHSALPDMLFSHRGSSPVHSMASTHCIIHLLPRLSVQVTLHHFMHWIPVFDSHTPWLTPWVPQPALYLSSHLITWSCRPSLHNSLDKLLSMTALQHLRATISVHDKVDISSLAMLGNLETLHLQVSCYPCAGLDLPAQFEHSCSEQSDACPHTPCHEMKASARHNSLRVCCSPTGAQRQSAVKV